MAILKKILTNVSGHTKTIINRELQHNESFEIPQSIWAKAADSDDLKNDIIAGLVLVSDGSNILSVDNALEHLGIYQVVTASGSSFDEDLILVDYDGVTLTDHYGNVLKDRD